MTPGMLPATRMTAAEFAQRARVGHDGTGGDAPPGDRQRDTEDHAQRRRAQGRRDLLGAVARGLERDARTAHDERKRHHGHGDSDRFPGKHHLDGEREEPAASTPLRPSRSSRRRPVATGGQTSGSATRVSTSDLPGQRRRASSHASAIPGTRSTSTASSAEPSVRKIACASLAGAEGPTMNPYWAKIVRASASFCR